MTTETKLKKTITIDLDEAGAAEIERLRKLVKKLERKIARDEATLNRRSDLSNFSIEKRNEVASAAKGLADLLSDVFWKEFDGYYDDL